MINNNNITQQEFKVIVQALFDNQTKFILVESIDGMDCSAHYVTYNDVGQYVYSKLNHADLINWWCGVWDELHIEGSPEYNQYMARCKAQVEATSYTMGEFYGDLCKANSLFELHKPAINDDATQASHDKMHTLRDELISKLLRNRFHMLMLPQNKDTHKFVAYPQITSTHIITDALNSYVTILDKVTTYAAYIENMPKIKCALNWYETVGCIKHGTYSDTVEDIAIKLYLADNVTLMQDFRKQLMSDAKQVVANWKSARYAKY